MSDPTPSKHALSDVEVARYREQGYLVVDRSVLPERRFQALRGRFDELLAELPSGERPEAMDVPHVMHPELLDWALDPAVLRLVEPIIGPDLALFSTHFICKPKGTGKRVPWHEDSAYWRGQMEPMEVCTLWLALDPSTRENGCMTVIPRSHREHVAGRAGDSDYEPVDTGIANFTIEIVRPHRDESRRVPIELEPNQASLHDARIQHGSEPNYSNKRRCGWTLRFVPTSVRFNEAMFDGGHQVYLAQGRDLAGNRYADPGRAYPEVMRRRSELRRYRHAH